jgi:hypothetical protein
LFVRIENLQGQDCSLSGRARQYGAGRYAAIARTSTMHKAWRPAAFYDAGFGTRRTRMRFVTIVALAVVGLGFGLRIGLGSGLRIGPLAQAAGQGEQVSWTEAQSLRELPAGIQALLGVGLGLAGIADRGETFNETDVTDDSMPRRRFVLAVLSGDTAMVALEQGGRMYSVRAVEFRQDGATWNAVHCAYMNVLPRRGTELVGVLSGKNAQPCGGFGIRAGEADPAAAPVLPARVRPRPGA